MSFLSNLKEIARNRRRHHPVSEVSAGRAAELRVAKILDERLSGTGWDYGAGLRVPDGRRKQEIDLVITTPAEIWLVELKNWSGFVRLEGDKVIQHRAGGRGVIDHGALLSKMRRKEKALRRYLKRSMADVPQTWSILVFCNDKVGLDEGLVGRDDLDVVGLREFVGALPLPEKGREPASETIKEAREVLRELGTWDLLWLHGGQILSGDLVSISVEGLNNRTRFKKLRFEVPRNYLAAFGSEPEIEIVAVERDGSEHREVVDLDQSLRFHAAGQRQPQQFSLRHLLGLSFG